MVKRILWSTLVLMLALSACGQMSIVDPAVATQWARDDQVRAANRASTQQVMGIEANRAESTLEAAKVNAEQWRASQTAMAAEATRVVQEATAQAQAVETEKAWTVAGWTATADVAISTATAQAQATQQAISSAQTQVADQQIGTATAQALSADGTRMAAQAEANATMEAAAMAANATVVAAQARSAQLAAERQVMVNTMVAWLPYVLGIVIAAMSGVLVWMYVRARVVQNTVVRDGGGNPVWYPDERFFTMRLLLPNRNPLPALISGPKGVSAPEIVDADLQANTTRRDQAIQALRSLPTGGPGGSAQRSNYLREAAGEGQPKRLTGGGLQVVEAGQVQTWLKDVMPQIYNEVIGDEVEHVETVRTE
jgi:hypothetical protein